MANTANREKTQILGMIWFIQLPHKLSANVDIARLEARHKAVLVVIVNPTVKPKYDAPDISRTIDLETTTTTTSLATGGVRWCWGDILNSSNLHSGTGESAESRLSSWAWGLGAVTTGSTDLDVESVNAELLAADSNILSSQHSSVWGGLVTIGLDLHSAGDTSDGFTATDITKVSF